MDRSKYEIMAGAELWQCSVGHLKELGFKIRIVHSRYYLAGFDVPSRQFHFMLYTHKELGKMKEIELYEPTFLENKGGQTEVWVTTPEGEELQGKGICRRDEIFVKKTGRQEALKKIFGYDEGWSLRKIFDRVKTHLLTQNKKSVKPTETNFCMYRGPDNTKCAVGCLIPDELYSKYLEEKTVNNELVQAALVSACVLPAKEGDQRGHMKLLAALQKIHDGTFVEEWSSELDKLEKEFFG